MAQKIFNRFGLRRDFNFSDLPDSRTALNNILKTPSMLSTEESFTTDDLTPIFGISATEITLDTFSGLSGTTVVFTLIDDDGTITDDTIIYRPLIKIKTQLDSSFFSSGEPYFFGGDGPNAYYYDSNDIIRDPEQLEFGKVYSLNSIVISNNQVYRVNSTEASASQNLTPETSNASGFDFIRNWEGSSDVYFADQFDEVTSKVTTISDNFWERGYFGFSEKIQLSFISLFGGVNWKGFFKPTRSGRTEFRINTTGSSIFKFQSSDSLSFQLARYGRPELGIMNTFQTYIEDEDLLTNSGISRYDIEQIKQIKAIYDDPTRQLVQVRLPRKQRLAHNDSIFIEVSEGQLPSKKYNILSHRTGSDDISNNGGDERDLIYFFIEVTKDFNLLNVDVNTELTDSKTGSTEDLNTGNITEGAEDLEGLLCTIRYGPYKRRKLKEYLNSTYHKLEIPQSSFTTVGNNLTCDEFFYNHLMINDYIYDYRKRLGDPDQGVRRFNVVGLDDDTRTATVEIDSTYSSVDDDSNNDQFYYLTPGSPVIIGNEEIDNTSVEIDEVYDSGTLSDTLDPSNTFDKLVFVGRYGERITRKKTITIDYFTDKFIDYAIDWYFYLKTEDVNQNSNNKIWTIETRGSVNNNFRSLNFKFLYDIDYDFFKIGDFKIFSENAILSSGTSRETGISQLPFGKSKLIEESDQYKILYSLLPISSVYTPPLNYNKIAKSGNINIFPNSRLITADSFTNFEVGNYVIINDDNGFLGTSTSSFLPPRTRIIDILTNDGIVLSKDSVTNSNITSPYVVMDHRGFVCTCLLNTGSSVGTSVGGENILISGQIDEIKIGMVVCIQSEPSRSTYCRITTIKEISGVTNITLDSDISNSTNLRAIIYRDNGVDISEPLKEFCLGSVCGQNNYNSQTAKVSTKYIALLRSKGSKDSTLDALWSQSAAGGTYDGTDFRRPHRYIYRRFYRNPKDDSMVTSPDGSPTNNTPFTFANDGNIPAVAYWLDARESQTTDSQQVSGYPNQAIKVGGSSQSYSAGNNPTGAKEFGGGVICAKLSGTEVGTAILEQYPNFPVNNYMPIGVVCGMIRVNGDWWANTQIANSEKYYYIVRINDEISSSPATSTGLTFNWTDSVKASDNSTDVPVRINLQEYPSSAFNITSYATPTNDDLSDMLPFGGNISNNATFTTAWNNGSPTNDRIWKITSDVSVSAATASSRLTNPTNIVQDIEGTITYVLKANTYLRSYKDFFIHFNSFDSVVDDRSLFAYYPDTITETIGSSVLSIDDTELINLFPGNTRNIDTPTTIENSSSTTQYRFMQYRKTLHEILPYNIEMESSLPGLRMINPNTTTTYTTFEGDSKSVKPNLQNATNALSVYTFTNTTDLKELCCPPLDTSPPFDSSEIGLSTTTTYPDMSINGVVNIRSFSANHPPDQILPIINTTTDQLPVDEKLEILFGNTKYKLLIGNTVPTNL